MARPTLYGPDILEKAQHYLLVLPSDEVVHSIEGLADFLDISRPTIYDWASKENEDGSLTYPEFSYIIESLMQKQGKKLINGSLKGELNANISKLMLTKHGLSDKQEVTGKDGEKLSMGVVILPAKNNEDSLGTTA